MNVREVLLHADPVIERLTKKYLLNQKVTYHEDGFIKRYLDLYEHHTNMWGHGVYGPKWISTHYTMMELRYMEISSKHPIYLKALNTLLDHEWFLQDSQKERYVDMCICGMLLSLSCYGNMKDSRIFEMIDYVMDHQMSDGGWNCLWHKKDTPHISSVHTTINVLEGLRDYDKSEYSYRTDEVKQAILMAVDMLLRRNLYQAHGTKDAIHIQMIKPSYPPRWKYDILRVLEFLESINYPDNLRITDAMNVLVKQMKGPFMPKGLTISGLTHFKLEENKYGMFNTLRALKVLKKYRYPLYQKLIQMDITK